MFRNIRHTWPSCEHFTLMLSVDYFFTLSSNEETTTWRKFHSFTICTAKSTFKRLKERPYPWLNDKNCPPDL